MRLFTDDYCLWPQLTTWKVGLSIKPRHIYCISLWVSNKISRNKKKKNFSRWKFSACGDVSHTMSYLGSSYGVIYPHIPENEGFSLDTRLPLLKLWDSSEETGVIGHHSLPQRSEELKGYWRMSWFVARTTGGVSVEPWGDLVFIKATV